MSHTVRMADGREIELWTPEEVEWRLKEMGDTLKRIHMPGIAQFNGVEQWRSAWPEMLREYWQEFANQVEDGPRLKNITEGTRKGPPSAEAITRMDQIISWENWFQHIAEPRIAKLVWMRALGKSFRKIGVETGYSHEKARYDWQLGVAQITDALNRQIDRQRLAQQKKFQAGNPRSARRSA